MWELHPVHTALTFLLYCPHSRHFQFLPGIGRDGVDNPAVTASLSSDGYGYMPTRPDHPALGITSETKRPVRNLSQNGYGYMHMYIRRPLQSVERVRLHFLAYNIQSLSSSTPRSKAQQRTSVQPAQVDRQLQSRTPILQAPRQLESRIWVPGCLDLIILSSYLLL